MECSRALVRECFVQPLQERPDTPDNRQHEGRFLKAAFLLFILHGFKPFSIPCQRDGCYNIAYPLTKGDLSFNGGGATNLQQTKGEFAVLLSHRQQLHLHQRLPSSQTVPHRYIDDYASIRGMPSVYALSEHPFSFLLLQG